MDKNREGDRMIDKLTTIESKIQQLKQKKERIQNQQALFLMKEAQKILKEEFSLETALNILRDSWAASSKAQRTEWTTRANSFPISAPKTHKKAKKHNPTPEQIGKAEIPVHDHH
ncbi:MAG: hypothetical protein A2X70_01975 [Alphaproteobacteria bacterium GWC2_42_16]|nr:MAG: hypothetical protein A2X70_01975 [Alphaproteobacteria bacterium GWC2_42_16]OFW73932.1 MAG: hypothetical protein A2Z80_02990 [Alphaproteobacteria bacterium GWA2_41_27]OFW82470.1 MAG: hypothetical protein A3E50_06915 [Alphaproteobacteria bacterium RIFCSPHIGHO2_12_FULL_42_100]OFW86611.1 MAG: hypothetical protein A2W06_08050 [Alphaproteobacteria bacterium RBG_16_42_14]OFW91481.1 MAG: hypothetical protein A3C41_07525 [Alphaproteobacteria bacterium RIFCSPHIGHO2_02_FULL_42_30]OFW92171.1 MAG: 